MGAKDPLGFESLVGGRLLQDMNAELVEAQQNAREKACPVVITLKLTICPPVQDEFGSMKYQLEHKLKRKASRAFSTEVNTDGLIAFDGTSPVDVKQIGMGLPEEPRPGSIITFNRRQAES